MSILWIRHGKDEEGYRGGWSTRGLTEEGHAQSRKLGRYFKDNEQRYKIHRIISSDLSRAWETAYPIGERLNCPVESSECWRETNNGLLAGMLNETANELYPGLYFSSLRMDERYPGGESPEEFFMRVKATCEKLCEEELARSSDEHVLIVTHGRVIDVIYHVVKNLEWSNASHNFPSAHTSIHQLQHRDGKWELAIENITPHLDQAT